MLPVDNRRLGQPFKRVEDMVNASAATGPANQPRHRSFECPDLGCIAFNRAHQAHKLGHGIAPVRVVAAQLPKLRQICSEVGIVPPIHLWPLEAVFRDEVPRAAS